MSIRNRTKSSTLSNDGVVTNSFTANSLNQYSSITNQQSQIVNLLYDFDGNLTNDGVYAYYWDAENRLIAVSNDSVFVKFKYDYMSRRYEKISGTTTNRFIYDSWNLISETINNQESTITNYYVWGLDLSGSLSGAGGIGGLLSVTMSTSSNLSTYFPFCDANGNITDYVDASGNVVASP